MHDPHSRRETIGSESCVSDVIRRRPLQTHTCLFTAMADSCRNSSEEEHAVLLGALAMQQQTNDEEERRKH